MVVIGISASHTTTLLAARHPFAIKPFYYANIPSGGLLFGSEIKAFLEHPAFEKAVNKNMLRSYLSFQYPAGAETFFEGVYSLPQGHYCVYQNGRMRTVGYWDVDFEDDETLGYDECVETIDDAVHESVAAHQISDVPVGSFLSGGVDSSYITACLNPENSVAVGFAQHKFD